MLNIIADANIILISGIIFGKNLKIFWKSKNQTIKIMISEIIDVIAAAMNQYFGI